MTEYYELIFAHRVQYDEKYDPYLEQPIAVKTFISPQIDSKMECEALIDEMCYKIKDYWIQTRKNCNHHD